MLLAQVVGIALFYVVIVSGVQVAERREELFSMRSRGASIWQVISHTAIEGVILAIVSAAAAPFIAIGVIGLLGYTPVFEPLTGGEPIRTTLTDMAFLLSASGAIVAVLFTLAPLIVASRTRVLSERLRNVSRPAGPNVLQRYFLDVALVLVAVGLIFEADLKGNRLRARLGRRALSRSAAAEHADLVRAGGDAGDPALPALRLSILRLAHLRPLPALGRLDPALREPHTSDRPLG